MNYWGMAGFTILYAVTVIATAFLGFLAPSAWVLFPIIAALLAAFSYYWIASRWQKFGVATLLSLVLALILLAMGEFEWQESLLMMATGIASDVVRQFVGNTTQKGMTLAYPLLPVGIIAWTLPLWTRTQWYYDGAAEELGIDYAKGLMVYASPWCLLLIICTILISGWVGIQFASKIIKE